MKINYKIENYEKKHPSIFSTIMYFSDIERHDSVLVQLYQELGSVFDSDEGFRFQQNIPIIMPSSMK